MLNDDRVLAPGQCHAEVLAPVVTLAAVDRIDLNLATDVNRAKAQAVLPARLEVVHFGRVEVTWRLGAGWLAASGRLPSGIHSRRPTPAPGLPVAGDSLVIGDG